MPFFCLLDGVWLSRIKRFTYLLTYSSTSILEVFSEFVPRLSGDYICLCLPNARLALDAPAEYVVIWVESSMQQVRQYDTVRHRRLCSPNYWGWATTAEYNFIIVTATKRLIAHLHAVCACAAVKATGPVRYLKISLCYFCFRWQVLSFLRV